MNEEISKGNVFSTLSGSGKSVYWTSYDGGRRVSWGKSNFNLPDEYINNILNNFFKDFSTWYPLGASMDDPIPGGLGEYVQKNFPSLTPRHDFREACPGLGEGTYNAFLHKHRIDNPSGNSELFEKVAPGQFKLVRPIKYGLD